jgi:pyruvate dehydrogenase E2 component (dihydrolipoamide acetyltransferase)
MSASIQKLGMPKWGLSMTQGRIVEWLVSEGTELAIGDEVAEVETEKINGVVEAPVAGMLRRRVAAEGDVVPVGGLLGVIAGAEVPDADIDAFVAEFEASFVPEEADEETGPATETVTVAGGALRFLRTGEGGEPLILLHGFGGDLNNWLFNVQALAADRAVYALDLPGHGGSTKKVGDGELGFLVAALRGFLESQGIERAHLAGHSMGGLVAAALACEDPGRVLSLTLVDSAGLGPEIDRDYIEGFVAASNRRELKPVLQRLFADPDLVTRQMIDDVLKYKRLDGVQEALRTLADRLFADGRQQRMLTDELQALRSPMLFIWGDLDQVIPAAQLNAAPARAETKLLPGSGHSPHMEAAGDFNRTLAGFLTGARGG